MNREILFRGRRTNTGEWVYGGLNSLSHSPNDKTYIVTNEFAEGDEDNEQFVFVEADPETIGQFTGLTDKNGTKIFEGDIIIFDDGRQGQIVWGHTRWVLQSKPFSKIEKSFSKMDKTDGESVIWLEVTKYSHLSKGGIIGNINDNPELIN